MPKKFKSVIPNWMEDLEGVNCLLKKWKGVGNWQAKWQLIVKSDNDS